ncbi:hypothetical protein Barb6_03287 [Bacteroidales bacterium Barb6]|nr:hypothetical protein Barb6_03287 [Bacteroidales bacterium Barb6]
MQAVGESYAGQGSTRLKDLPFDPFQTVAGEGYGSQRGAVSKGSDVKLYQSFGEDYAGQRGAAEKGFIINLRQVVGQGYAGQGNTGDEGLFSDSSYACLTAAGEIYGGQSGAVGKGFVVNLYQAAGQGYAGQGNTECEGFFPDGCYTVGDGYGCEGTVFEKGLSEFLYGKSLSFGIDLRGDNDCFGVQIADSFDEDGCFLFNV